MISGSFLRIILDAGKMATARRKELALEKLKRHLMKR